MATNPTSKAGEETARANFFALLKTKKQHWKELADETVERIVARPWSKLNGEKPQSPDPRERLEYLVKIQFETALNCLLPSTRRHQSLQLLTKLLDKASLAYQKLHLDALASNTEFVNNATKNRDAGTRNSKKANRSAATTVTQEQSQARNAPEVQPRRIANDTRKSSNAVTRPNAVATDRENSIATAHMESRRKMGEKRKHTPQTASNEPPRKKAPSVSAQATIRTVPQSSTATHQKGSASNFRSVPQASSATRQQKSAPNISSATERVSHTAAPAISNKRIEARNPQSEQNKRPRHGSAQSNQSVAHMQAQKRVEQVPPPPSAAQKSSVSNKKAPPAPPPPRTAVRTGGPSPTIATPQYGPVTKMWFQKDKEKLACTLDARDTVQVLYRPLKLGTLVKNGIIARLSKWEPYWDLRHLVFMEQTMKVDVPSPVPTPKNLPPATHVLSKRFKLSDHVIEKLGGPQKFGKRLGKPEDGEARLILQMLPLEEPPPMDGSKQRADYHLWPMGTYLQLDGTGQHLVQRKQQAHNAKKWLGLCHHLDLMPLIKNPQSEVRLDLLHAEDRPFVATLALCEYKTPNRLFKLAKLDVVSYADGLEMAKKRIQQNMQNIVVLDNDDEALDPTQQSMTFKLICPITFSPAGMTKPVRSKRCDHFNCVDLRSYLESNARVSGGRWECPVCNKKHAAIEDLQVCEFTQRVVQACREKVSGSRQTVELFADGRWELRKAKSNRYAKRSEQKKTTVIEDDVDSKGALQEEALIDLLWTS